MFRIVPLSIIRSIFHFTHSSGICHRILLTACTQAVSKPLRNIPLLCVKWKAPDYGQRNYPKHVEFYSKNKFENLVHIHVVGFIIRISYRNIKAGRIWLSGGMLSSRLYSNSDCCSAIVCIHKSMCYWEVCLELKELISEQLQPISTEYCKFYPTCNIKN